MTPDTHTPSTNARLGYPEDARLLIVNADDFGMCHANNEAIVRSLLDGIVTSTTLMTPCPWAPQAIQMLREHPEIPVYVIGTGDGDFHEVVKTLQAQGKQVILWTTRRSVSESYGGSLRGPDRIRIEWLEDLVFGDVAGGDAR